MMNGILITLRKLFPAALPKRRLAVSNANKPASRYESAIDRRFEPKEIQLKCFFPHKDVEIFAHLNPTAVLPKSKSKRNQIVVKTLIHKDQRES